MKLYINAPIIIDGVYICGHMDFLFVGF